MAEAPASALRGRPNSTVIQRAQAVTLLENGIAIKIAAAITELSEATVYKWRKTAKDRGWNPAISSVLKEAHLIDASRSGRSPKVTAEVEKAILDNVRSSKNGKEKTSAVCV